MSRHPGPIELLRDLAAVFEAERVRWYVFGAQAVATYGVPRLTGDVDVTAEIAPGRVAELVAAMESAGFQLRVDDPREFVARARVLPFWHRPTNIPLDVVLAGPGLEQGFLDRATRVSIGELELPVIAAADLVVTKILAGRPKDLEDVRGILRQQAVDLDSVRATLRAIEQAIDQSDLLPSFERLLDEI